MKMKYYVESRMTKKQNKMDWASCTDIIRYRVQDTLGSVSSTKQSEHAHMEWVITPVEHGQRMQLFLFPLIKMKMTEIRCDLKHQLKKEDRLFFNGYQSWTDSHELSVSDKMPSISPWLKSLVKHYQLDRYGDSVIRPFSRKRGHFHGFSFTTVDTAEHCLFLGSLNEKNGFTILEYRHDLGLWTIFKDMEGCALEDKACVLDLVCLEGYKNDVYDTYFDLLGIVKPRIKHATGWTSWYNYYQHISQDIIEKNLHAFDDHNKVDIFQIDDGYQTAVGDWLSIDQTKFNQGMKPIAEKIHAKGMKAGLWLAPFVAEKNSVLLKEHPNWFIKGPQGILCSGGSNWGGFYALDLELPEVKSYLIKVFDVVLNDWGFDMVKLDFLYAACMIPRNNKSRGQLMAEAMMFIRKCVGDKIILACGVPLASSFGLVDFCRIGCDVGLDWNDHYYMRFLHRERISTQQAIGNSIGRRHLDGRAFTNDPDVFLLRDTNIKLTTTQKKTLALANWLFGSLLFTSDDLSTYSLAQRESYESVVNLKKPIITSVISSQGLVGVSTESGDTYYLNLSAKARKVPHKTVMLKPYESIKEVA